MVTFVFNNFSRLSMGPPIQFDFIYKFTTIQK